MDLLINCGCRLFSVRIQSGRVYVWFSRENLCLLVMVLVNSGMGEGWRGIYG